MEINVDSASVTTAFRKLRAVTNDLTPALKDIGEYYLLAVDDRFKDERDHNGQPWAVLTPKYAKWKRRQPTAIQKKNQLTGLMRAGMNYRVSPDEVRIGSDKIYARRRNEDRPFLDPSDRNISEFVGILKDHTQFAWNP